MVWFSAENLYFGLAKLMGDETVVENDTLVVVPIPLENLLHTTKNEAILNAFMMKN